MGDNRLRRRGGGAGDVTRLVFEFERISEIVYSLSRTDEYFPA